MVAMSDSITPDALGSFSARMVVEKAIINQIASKLSRSVKDLQVIGPESQA